MVLNAELQSMNSINTFCPGVKGQCGVQQRLHHLWICWCGMQIGVGFWDNGVDVSHDQPFKAFHGYSCECYAAIVKQVTLAFMGTGAMVVSLKHVGITDQVRESLKMSVKTLASYHYCLFGKLDYSQNQTKKTTTHIACTTHTHTHTHIFTYTLIRVRLYQFCIICTRLVSHPDHSLLCMFLCFVWSGCDLSGHSMLDVFVCFCVWAWYGSQRQVLVIVSDWEPYLGSLFCVGFCG